MNLKVGIQKLLACNLMCWLLCEEDVDQLKRPFVKEEVLLALKNMNPSMSIEILKSFFLAKIYNWTLKFSSLYK